MARSGKARRERRRREIEELIGEIAAEQRVSLQEFREIREMFREIGRENQRIGRQVGEVTGAWGRFAEDLLAPSVQAAVRELGVQIEFVDRRMRSRREGAVLKETDLVIVGVHGRPARPVCFVVSATSQARPEDVDRLVRDVERFHDVHPSQRGAELVGLLAAVGIHATVRERAIRMGLYVVETGDRVASIVNPAGFRPRVWPAAC